MRISGAPEHWRHQPPEARMAAARSKSRRDHRHVTDEQCYDMRQCSFYLYSAHGRTLTNNKGDAALARSSHTSHIACTLADQPISPMAPTGFCDLPTEALDEIARRVGPLDNVACSAVCRPWRRALKTTRLRLLRRPNLPHHVCVEPRYKDSPWESDYYYKGGPKRQIWTNKIFLEKCSGVPPLVEEVS
jgi:hypothetical protein